MYRLSKKWAYYNEIDKQKAEWIRQLIKAGLVTDGEVDERSIVDVKPDDVRGFRRCHWFAGIAIWDYALRLAGWPEDWEIWSGSCPCGPFSAAGKGKAFNDERHLWPEFFRLIEARRPLVAIGEQVSSIDGLAWFDLVHSGLDNEGYTCGVLDTSAACVGSPHRRQRLYWVAHASIIGHNGRWPSEEIRRTIKPERFCDADGMGNTSRAGLEVRSREPGDPRQEFSTAERIGNAGGMDNSTSTRHNGTISASKGDSWNDARMRLSSERGPVNGFWGSADWVLTRPQRVGDRPGLRPIESRPQQMAHGSAAGVGRSSYSGFPLAEKEEARTMRLRGYGDGIVAEVAVAFIRAYMETLKMGPRET